MTEESPCAIDVNYTLGDLYAVTLQSWRSHLVRLLPLPAIVLIILIVLAAVGGSSVAESVLEFPWEFILGLVALILVLRAGVVPFANYLDGRRNRDLGPIRFELSGEGIRIEARDGKSILYWSAVRRVKATKNRLFLFTGPALAYILPRRAFSEDTDFAQAVEQARHNWQLARA